MSDRSTSGGDAMMSVIPSHQARNPHRPDREPSDGNLRILRFAQDDNCCYKLMQQSTIDAAYVVFSC